MKKEKNFLIFLNWSPTCYTKGSRSQSVEPENMGHLHVDTLNIAKIPLSFICAEQKVQVCVYSFTHGACLECFGGGRCSLASNQAMSLAMRWSSRCLHHRGLGAGQLGATSETWTVSPLCYHPNLFLSHGDQTLIWAFLTSLTHLNIAQSLGSGLKWHYFWLLMTSSKPAVQFKYPQECLGAISTRY